MSAAARTTTNAKTAASPPPPTAAPNPPDFDQLALLSELEDRARDFFTEVNGAREFIDHMDEHVDPAWQAALGVFIPVLRRFANYAELFEDLADDLRKAHH